jgi:hypothetical protein
MEDGPGPILQARPWAQRDGEHRRPAEAGQPTWRRRARQGSRPRGRDKPRLQALM